MSNLSVCQNCGENINDVNTKKCPTCGETVNLQTDDLPSTSPTPIPDIPIGQNNANPSAIVKNKKNTNIVLITAFVILTIALIISLTIIFTNRNKIQQTTDLIPASSTNYSSTNIQETNPSVGNPISYSTTGTNGSKKIVLDIPNGEIAIVGGYTINKETSGSYKAVGPGHYSFDITDGFWLITTSDLAHDEWNFRIQEAYDNNWALSHQDSGPIQFTSFTLESGKNIAPCDGYISGDVVINEYKRYDNNSDTFAITAVQKGDIITTHPQWLGWFSNYSEGYIESQVKLQNPIQTRQNDVKIKWDGNW